MATSSRLIESKALKTDVLLICAEDTHASVTGNLLNALQQRGFRTILVGDRQELERKVIEDSMIFIVILSERYPFSPTRLDELAEIVDEVSKGKMGQRLLVFFYNVEPADVGNQTRSYGKALAEHKNCVESEKFERWRNALTKVTDFTSCHFRDGDTYEYQCIEEILQLVSEHVASTIGIHPRVKEVIPLLYPVSEGGVHVVGICGDPGMGKKTIARRVCDYLIDGHGFDNYCILLNVGEKLRGHGSVHLPRMLLSELVGDNYIGFGNFEEGMSVIKRTLDQKKVLIVLDGINCSDSFEAVAELTNCLGSESRVLITAQDKSWLESRGIEKIYEVKGLDRTFGCQLLCLKAFSSMNMSFKFANIIDRAETYAAGNPLILEAIGSHFRGKTIARCESALDQIERIPIADLIQNMVRESDQMFLFENSFEENTENSMRDAESASDDGSGIWDTMESECQNDP